MTVDIEGRDKGGGGGRLALVVVGLFFAEVSRTKIRCVRKIVGETRTVGGLSPMSWHKFLKVMCNHSTSIILRNLHNYLLNIIYRVIAAIVSLYGKGLKGHTFRYIRCRVTHNAK